MITTRIINNKKSKKHKMQLIDIIKLLIHYNE